MLAQTQLIPRVPVAEWANSVVGWITKTLEPITEPLDALIEGAVGGLAFMLTAPPELIMIVVFAAIAFLLAGWRVALFTVVGLVLIISLDLWAEAMLTLSLVLASAVTALVIGIPIGIIAAKSQRTEAVAMPVLDTMQTMPAFVYLVPVALVFSLGETPALIATVVFAAPPAVRLTMLGIHQVPTETVEAAHAFGSTPWQTLMKVELPLSVRSIMAGVNQVIMLSLSMVVIAALVGASGLGEPVLVGLGNLDVGAALVGGLGIVILAIVLDRITRGFERKDRMGISMIRSRKRSNSASPDPLAEGGSTSGGGSGG
ncbi:MAG: ABC transporter permease subunit [Actinomycetota bacterium]|nr:ABC transporter permease subunit [Rubrobacteraceae bacterium]MDQ3437327.1 ABC transporter permease subunit [Actinomycetota bacterium]